MSCWKCLYRNSKKKKKTMTTYFSLISKTVGLNLPVPDSSFNDSWREIGLGKNSTFQLKLESGDFFIYSGY